jgi:hypothetical protein
MARASRLSALSPQFRRSSSWWTPTARPREPSRVLVLIHPKTDTGRAAVQAVIAAYGKAFDQEAVLWERARMCVAG